jgi:Mg2+ and Co2+ transporter CorA
MFDKLIEKIDKDIMELEDEKELKDYELKRIMKLKRFYMEIHKKILRNKL